MPLLLRKLQATGLAVGLLAGALISSAALAQGESQPSPVQSSPKPAKNITDQEIDQAAAVVLELRRITGNYSEKMYQAKGKQQVHQMRKTMQQEMQQAIEEQGLSVMRYKSIISASQKNQGLRQKLIQRIQEREAK